MPNFTFYEERKQAKSKFSLSLKLDIVFRNSTPGKFLPTFDKVGEFWPG